MQGFQDSLSKLRDKPTRKRLGILLKKARRLPLNFARHLLMQTMVKDDNRHFESLSDEEQVKILKRSGERLLRLIDGLVEIEQALRRRGEAPKGSIVDIEIEQTLEKAFSDLKWLEHRYFNALENREPKPPKIERQLLWYKKMRIIGKKQPYFYQEITKARERIVSAYPGLSLIRLWCSFWTRESTRTLNEMESFLEKWQDEEHWDSQKNREHFMAICLHLESKSLIELKGFPMKKAEDILRRCNRLIEKHIGRWHGMANRPMIAHNAHQARHMILLKYLESRSKKRLEQAKYHIRQYLRKPPRFHHRIRFLQELVEALDDEARDEDREWISTLLKKARKEFKGLKEAVGVVHLLDDHSSVLGGVLSDDEPSNPPMVDIYLNGNFKRTIECDGPLESQAKYLEGYPPHRKYKFSYNPSQGQRIEGYHRLAVHAYYQGSRDRKVLIGEELIYAAPISHREEEIPDE